MKKGIWLLVLLVCIGWVIWWKWYSDTLQTSKEEVAHLQDRAITEEDFLADREKTEDAIAYREEQQDMLKRQEWLEEDMKNIRTQLEPPTPVLTWKFNKLDPIHFAKWWVEILIEWEDTYIILSDEFSTPNGPDLYVMLSSSLSETYNESDDFLVGALSKKEGKQIYKIPSETFESYNSSVKIRCRAFDVMFSVAELK